MLRCDTCKTTIIVLKTKFENTVLNFHHNYHEILRLHQEKIREKSGDFVFLKCWEPCFNKSGDTSHGLIVITITLDRTHYHFHDYEKLLTKLCFYIQFGNSEIS